MKTRIEFTFVAAALLVFANNDAAEITFTKITTGSIATNNAQGWGAAWGDFDDDGFIDLVVGNQGSRNLLYRNNGDGTFTQITTGPLVSFVLAVGAGMALADYDNDGHLDVIAGGWDERNKLFHNNGDGTFTQTSGSGLDADPSGLT